MNTSEATLSTRRHDVDWLRTIALGLLIVYHVSIAFQPFGGMLFFITNEDSITALWPAMALMNIWRIPLLFIVSGMGAAFAMQRRGAAAFLGDRSLRILLPLLFGFLVICPLYMAIALRWFGLPIQYVPTMGHLWFLGNIAIYVATFLPIFLFLRKDGGIRLLQRVGRALGNPWLLFLILLPLMAEAWLVQPDVYAKYFNSLHGLMLGGVCFLLGFFLASLGAPFWKAVQEIRWPALLIAAVLYFLRLGYWKMAEPSVVTAIESGCWMLGIFGFGSRWLNRPSAVLSYLSASVYTVYIVHMPVQYAVSYLVVPTLLAPVAKFVLVTAGTFLGSFALYEIIRRMAWIRPLFGLKLRTTRKSKIATGAPLAGSAQPLPTI